MRALKLRCVGCNACGSQVTTQAHEGIETFLLLYFSKDSIVTTQAHEGIETVMRYYTQNNIG